MSLQNKDPYPLKDYNNKGFCECPNGLDWYCINYEMKENKYNCKYQGLGLTCDYENNKEDKDK